MNKSHIQEERERKFAQADRDLAQALTPLEKIREEALRKIETFYVPPNSLSIKARMEERSRIWDDFNEAAKPFEKAHDEAVAETMELKE